MILQEKPNKFTLGDEESKEYSDDDDNDVVVGAIDQKLARQKSTEGYIPNVGILMSNADIKVPEIQEEHYTPNISDVSLKKVIQQDVNVKKYPLLHSATETKIDVTKVNFTTTKGTPGIVIEKEKSKVEPPKTLLLDQTNQQRLSATDSLDKSKKLSHSSGEVDSNDKERRVESGLTVDGSERDVMLGISSSQSETALKSITNVLASPSAVLSPFSKLAKGVQNFGANLDPRKVVEKVGTKQAIPLDHIAAQNAKLEERWETSKCKSRLIAV